MWLSTCLLKWKPHLLLGVSRLNSWSRPVLVFQTKWCEIPLTESQEGGSEQKYGTSHLDSWRRRKLQFNVCVSPQVRVRKVKYEVSSLKELLQVCSITTPADIPVYFIQRWFVSVQRCSAGFCLLACLWVCTVQAPLWAADGWIINSDSTVRALWIYWTWWWESGLFVGSRVYGGCDEVSSLIMWCVCVCVWCRLITPQTPLRMLKRTLWSSLIICTVRPPKHR